MKQQTQYNTIIDVLNKFAQGNELNIVDCVTEGLDEDLITEAKDALEEESVIATISNGVKIWRANIA